MRYPTTISHDTPAIVSFMDILILVYKFSYK